MVLYHCRHSAVSFVSSLDVTLPYVLLVEILHQFKAHRSIGTSMSTMQKPLKTERTHEENQERYAIRLSVSSFDLQVLTCHDRAYIAASRRSDRSLEARLESARRASEIHKKRTGRALRVTEQDVLNEEMYEEEDDDIPFAYRRMTAHMQIDNPEFHRKFQAYMATQVESRRQLSQAVMNSYQQNPGLYGQGPGQAPSPFMGSSNMMQMPSPSWQQTGGMPPQMFSRASPVNTMRPSPYPGSNGMSQDMRPGSHGRSMSIANPQNIHMQQRRPTPVSFTSHTANNSPVMPKKEGMSPASTSSGGKKSPPLFHAGNKRKRDDEVISPTASKDFASNNIPTPKQAPTPPQQTPHQRHYSYGGPYSAGAEPQHNWSNVFAPLDPTLPANTQDILGDNPHFDFSDPTMAMMMPPQQQQHQQPFSYSYNPNGKPKSSSSSPMTSHANSGGLNQTLLSLDTNPGPKYDPSLPSAGTDYLDSASLDPTYNFGNFGTDLFGPSSGFNSGTATPGDNGWMDNYLQDNSFVDETGDTPAMLA